mmetsp:Transcript_8910/g.26693  ORF Transcript_8910/g.26693 Transcript_8910/m.26693 type:complete len:373 (-) Transcript_8910:96-1214(-)
MRLLFLVTIFLAYPRLVSTAGAPRARYDPSGRASDRKLGSSSSKGSRSSSFKSSSSSIDRCDQQDFVEPADDAGEQFAFVITLEFDNLCDIDPGTYDASVLLYSNEQVTCNECDITYDDTEIMEVFINPICDSGSSSSSGSGPISTSDSSNSKIGSKSSSGSRRRELQGGRRTKVSSRVSGRCGSRCPNRSLPPPSDRRRLSHGQVMDMWGGSGSGSGWKQSGLERHLGSSSKSHSKGSSKSSSSKSPVIICDFTLVESFSQNGYDEINEVQVLTDRRVDCSRDEFCEGTEGFCCGAKSKSDSSISSSGKGKGKGSSSTSKSSSSSKGKGKGSSRKPKGSKYYGKGESSKSKGTSKSKGKGGSRSTNYASKR